MVSGEARAARRAVAVVFFLNGLVFASWVPRIPEVKAALGLGAAGLGAALLGMALGSLVAMAAAGALVGRRGSRPVTRVALAAFCAVPGLVGLAPSWAWLFLALTVWGATTGALDVAMNGAGLAVQRRYTRSIMSGFHACFSAGTLAGAGAGSLAAHFSVGVPVHLAGTGLLALAAGTAATRSLLPAAHDAQEAGPVFVRPTRPLLLLSALAFAALLAEGAAADWSAVYLRDVLGTGGGLAGAGYAAFALAMTAGRMAGDRLVTLLGPARMVRVLATAAAVAFGGALVIGEPWAAVAGLTVLGLGLACVVPMVFLAAATATGAPGPSVAAVSTVGYLGFLVGPPLIGALAELVGLGVALGVVAALVAFLAVAAGAMSHAEAQPAGTQNAEAQHAEVPSPGAGDPPAGGRSVPGEARRAHRR
ncbi:MFS transporter [Actinomadura miaoliensis]|uniref:MFS transporter n=1 Tax=Actinomadura miaoliensis TaxID=430685 RepID=A0ABP7WW39_9ACTN